MPKRESTGTQLALPFTIVDSPEVSTSTQVHFYFGIISSFSLHALRALSLLTFFAAAFRVWNGTMRDNEAMDGTIRVGLGEKRKQQRGSGNHATIRIRSFVQGNGR